MGCNWSATEEEESGTILNRHNGVVASDTNIRTSTKRGGDDVPKSSSHFQSSVARDRKPSVIQTKLESEGARPAVEKQRSRSVSIPVPLDAEHLQHLQQHDLSRNKNGRHLGTQGTASPAYRLSPSLGAIDTPPPRSEPGQNALSTTPPMPPILLNPQATTTDAPTTTTTTTAAVTIVTTTLSISTPPSSSPTTVAPPQQTPSPLATNSPNRGSIRDLLSRERSLPKERDHSNSPTPNDNDTITHHSSQPSAGGGAASPLRRDLATRGMPPALNLQSKVRLARELDSDPGLMDISPRLSARMSQTAAIRRDLARQASLSQQALQAAQAGRSASPVSQNAPSFHATGIIPTGSPSIEAGDRFSNGDSDARSRGTVLNPRRAGGAGLESPLASARFLPSPTAHYPTSSRLNKRSVSGFSQAIDLIDATSGVVPEQPDFSPQSRHSLRASRHSLGQPPVPYTPDQNAGRRSTRGRGRGRRIALIVDNNTLSQRLTSVALHRAGFTCCDLASEGETAISMASSTRYELILIDASLPTLSTLETVKAIRWMEDQRGDVPTVIIAMVQSLDANTVALQPTSSPNHSISISSLSPEQYKSHRVNACLERGCILTESVVEIMDALSRNSNFLTLAASGAKVQEPRTEAQEREEAELAMRVGMPLGHMEKRTISPVALARDYLSPGVEGGVPVVRSNRRTTSTGRSFPAIVKMSSIDQRSPSPNQAQSLNPSAAVVGSSPSSSPSPIAFERRISPGHPAASARARHSPSPPHSPSSSNAFAANISIHPANANAPLAIPAKPRRASLSIHSFREIQKQ